MLDFIIFKNKTPDNFKFDSISWSKVENKEYSFFFKAGKHEFFYFNEKTVLIIGDYWNVPSENELENKYHNFEYIIKNIKGAYYYFIFDQTTINVISGFLNLNPVYYSEKYSFSTSSYKLIKDSGLSYTTSQRYILETALFNHAFTDNTIYNEVKLLNTHYILKFENNSITTSPFWDVTKLYSDKPSLKKEIYNSIVLKFIATVKQYVPGSGSLISFTGGFDGRTIVSASMYLNKKFDVFSFGKNENDDVKIPKANSEELGLAFEHIDASENSYINNDYITNAKEIIEQTGGFNGLLYPHFLFFSKTLSNKTAYIITGYGGSELFRATHIFGAVTSKALYDLITIDDFAVLKQELLNSSALKMVSEDLIKNNIDQLVNDILSFKKKLTRHTTKNKQLYDYMLNESLRKIFGTWQSSQQRHINIRSPFFDYELIENVFQTNLAGVYNDFYTKNPVKRFKGQLFYALAIRATNKIIYNQITGKGYKPKDLLSITGKISMLYPFIKKRFTKKIKKQSLDNLSIISGFKKYIAEEPVCVNEQLFNKVEVMSALKNLNEFTPELIRDSVLSSISISAFLQ